MLVYRGATVALRAAERLSRRGPPVLRLALVSLARAPTGPALAIACLAVSTGLGGFALAYRATLERGETDAAADRVPLDAVIGPSAAFTTPLALAPERRWRALAHGTVLAVRRTDASYARGAAAVTVPAIGVPAPAWPASTAGTRPTGRRRWRNWPGGSRHEGPVRTPGPLLPPGARWLVLAARTRGGAAVVTADLRRPDGGVTRADARDRLSARRRAAGSPAARTLRTRGARHSALRPGWPPPAAIRTARIRPPRRRPPRPSRSGRCGRRGRSRARRRAAGDRRLARRRGGRDRRLGAGRRAGGLRIAITEGGQPGVVRPAAAE